MFIKILIIKFIYRNIFYYFQKEIGIGNNISKNVVQKWNITLEKKKKKYQILKTNKFIFKKRYHFLLQVLEKSLNERRYAKPESALR